MVERKAEVKNFKTYVLNKDIWGSVQGRMLSGVAVRKDEEVIWKKVPYEFFQIPKILFSDLDIRKPFYEKRLIWAKKQAQKIADRENGAIF